MDESHSVALTANPDTGDVSAAPIDTVAPLHQPGRFVTPAIWVIIVLAFAIPMILAALALMLEFVAPGPKSDKVEASMILLLFSTPAAFLSGLVIPSPINRR
jgi:hypothetical protein